MPLEGVKLSVRYPFHKSCIEADALDYSPDKLKRQANSH